MPRKKRGSLKRERVAEPKYHDMVVSRFITKIMFSGKKSVAEGIVYGAFDVIEKTRKEDPVKFFKEALENIKPVLEVRSRRVGGATYQVPTPVRPARSEALALRWLHRAAQSRKGMPMAEKLGLELKDVIDGKGIAVKKKDDVLRMAEANKAFAHFRW